MAGDAYLCDALRHEIARVATLGVAGVDTAGSTAAAGACRVPEVAHPHRGHDAAAVTRSRRAAPA